MIGAMITLIRKPQRHPVAPQDALVHADLLGDVGGGVSRPLPLEDTLHGEERQPVLLDGPPQILERDAVAGQVLEQLLTRLAGLAARPVQQSLALEVDGHGGRLSQGAGATGLLEWAHGRRRR